MNDANATPESGKKKASARRLSLALLFCGLALLATQFILQQRTPIHGEQEWTAAEQNEFRELQTLVHKSPSAALPSGDEMSKVYARMDKLDAVRIERRDQAATRGRWLRMLGASSLAIGLALYFVGQSASDRS